MTARELMTSDPGACAPDDDLMTVLLLMRERQCGWAPVVDSRGTVVGVITDRDAAMAMVQFPTSSASAIAARAAMTADVVACVPGDTIRAVLTRMAMHHVRRLPVLDERRHLQGVISIDDIVCAVERRGMPSAETILEALRSIVSRRGVADAASQ